MELAVVPPLRRALRPEIAPDPLRDRLAVHVERDVLALLDPARLEAQAEDLGLVQRHRVHHAGLIVCAWVLAAFARSTDTEGRMLDAQRTYRALGGADSGATSFRNQSRKLLPLFHRLLRRRLRALTDAADTPALRGRLAAFADVLIPDGCAFKVANALAGVYAGTGQPAEFKLHAVYCVRAGAVTTQTATAGSVHDSDGFWPEAWEPDALYLWDLGYNHYGRFIDAATAGSHVVQRLKDTANPVALASYGPTGARRTLPAGADGRPMRLQEATEFGHVHHQRVLDLDVLLAADDGRTHLARVVCVPCDGADYWYLTTLPRELFTPHDIAELYRIRWEAELFFRTWKGGVRLDEVRRLSNPQSLQVAVTTSLLAALLSRALGAALEQLAAETPPPPPAAFSPCASR